MLDPLVKLLSQSGLMNVSYNHIIMVVICLVILYLAIVKKMEPLLLVPIGFAGILVNIPLSGINELGGILHSIYNFGIGSGPDSATVFPLLIFMGIGAMTDFSALLSNPKTMLLGAASQVGIFTTILGAVVLSDLHILDFTLEQASSIGIIGGADGPTSIYISSKLAPELLGAISISAYSYMALVPIIQPPIMRLLTTENERKIMMINKNKVSKVELIVFPIVILILIGLFLPTATALFGMFCFGNLISVCGQTNRLSHVAQNSLINIVTLLLGLAIGSKLNSEEFLKPQTLGILALGIVAFSVGTASGILMAKLMNKFLKEDKINPLIGASGVSAVPMSARVVNAEGLKYNNQNFLLMHAMAPNVAGVIGSAVAGGIILSFFS